MAQGKQETRAEEIARVRSYLANQAMRRTPEQLIEALREAQQQFLAATAAVPDSAFRATPKEGEWSAADVLAHVRRIAAFDERSICGVLERGEQPANVADVLEQAPMKLAIQFGVSTYTSSNEEWASAVAYAVEAERLGVDSAWTAETWGYDGATPLAYLAAKTTRIRLGAGILQVGARTPALIAMTAMALASLSGDRFLLGLGVSGPQVIEGWYGVPFARPLQRLRETAEIVRKVTRGERLVYHGEVYHVPLPDGEGKALTSNVPPRPELPLYLATLGPKSLELTGELADGWLGTSFIPEHASLFFDPIAAGAAQAGRTLADLDLQVAAGVVAFSDDVESLIALRKPGLAFTLGAMGSQQHNFYNDVYRRAGYADIALEVQDLWFKKQREAAAARIPDELVLKTNLIGTQEMVRDRLRAHRHAGVNTLQVSPDGQTLDERLATLARLIELVREINDEP